MGTDVFMKWKEIFSQSSLFTDVFVWLGWALAKGLKVIVDGAEMLVDEIYNLIDFTSYAGMDKFFSNADLRLLLAVLFAGSLVTLGITLIFQGDKERPKILQNLLIAVLVITALPSAMTMLNDITLQAKNAILGEQGSTSDRIVADNVIDLVYLDSQGFNNYSVDDGRVSSPSGKPVNGFSGNAAKNVKYIDIQEKVTDEYKNKLNSPDYFFNVLKTNSNGTLQVEELKSNTFFGFDFTGWYYRYHVDYLVIFISLLATGVALFFVSFKAAKMIFDLAVHGFLAVVFSAGDLTNGQRTKKVLQSIGSIYIVLILCVVMIKFFYLGSAFISANISNGFVKAIALLFFAFAVIDGPNIVESMLGIDVGLRSGFQTMATMFMASRMVTSATGSIARTTGKLAGGAAGGAVGGVKNAISNFKAETGNMNDMKNNTSNDTKLNSESQQGGTNNLYGDGTAQNNAADGESGKGTENLNTSGSDAPTSDTATNSKNQSNLTDPLENGENAVTATSAADISDNANEQKHADSAQNNLSADNPANAPESPTKETSTDNLTAQNNLNTGSEKQTSINQHSQQSQPQSQLNPRSVAGATQQGYRTGKKVGGAVGGGIGKAAGKAAKAAKNRSNIKGDDK